MNTAEEMKELVSARVRAAFGELPVAVQESPEDSTTLWVQVFAVPAEKVKEVRQFILAMQDELLAVSDVILLPMVKNLAVTREHYPQHAPRDPAPIQAAIGWFSDELRVGRYVPRCGVIATAVGFAERMLAPELLRCAMRNDAVLTSRAGKEVMAAANEELALAA